MKITLGISLFLCVFCWFVSSGVFLSCLFCRFFTKLHQTKSNCGTSTKTNYTETKREREREWKTDLQVLGAEVVPVHVDGGEEDGLHLVVAMLVGRLVGRDQHLNRTTRTLSVTGSRVCSQKGWISIPESYHTHFVSYR